MLPRAIEVLRDEQPARHLLAVGTRIVDELRLDERGSIDRCRHRIRQPDRCPRGDIDDEQVSGIVRVGVLIDDLRSVGRPDRRRVGAAAARDPHHGRVRGIVVDRGDADVAIAGTVGFVGIERDARAVARPRGTPRLEFAFRNLNRFARLKPSRSI